jgi:hypothetical protein
MSEQLQQEVIDKTGWGDGPWMNEPDREEWIHAGYACLIKRSELGNWCGYVGVDNEHPYYGKGYNDASVSVHGGLTYADACQGTICHVPAPGMPDDIWWFGFDCAHAYDYVPQLKALMKRLKRHDDDVYRDLAYVKAEVNGLAEQLREIAGK